jgi:DNA-3-methyladenine glycosylase II
MHTASLTIQPVPPYRLDLTVWALKRRPDYVADRWNGTTYSRVLSLSGSHGVPVLAAVEQDGPRLHVSLSSNDGPLTEPLQADARAALERLLGTSIDLSGFYRAAEDTYLTPLALLLRGLKPPRYATLFEALANAVTCQQITLTAGLRILNRLTEAYGAPFTSAEGGVTAYAFPRAEDVAGRATPEDLRALGYSRQKARAMLEIAEELASGRLDLPALEALDDDTALTRLRRLHGVGRWTAEYVLLRGLGRLHVFPGDDVGVRKRVEQWLGLTERLDYPGVRKALTRWERHGGVIYLHLLVRGIADNGLVEA